MGIEDEQHRFSKENRRKNQEADKKREFSHPFKLVPHEPNEKHRARIRKAAEIKARKK